jgi:aryl-alcohol dehydrogenase-like predicted oxidoreductase
MKYVNLGRSGLKVSPLCLGCMSFGEPGNTRQPWALNEADARPFFRRAVDAGLNFFDTADAYSWGTSEEITGKLVREMLPRDDAVIATKVFNPTAPDGVGPNAKGLSRKWIMTAIDATLRRLGTDYVDLYIIHRFDRRTPVEETMQALHDVVKAGKARYLGASSMYAYQFAGMQHVAERRGWTKFVSMQNLYNLAWREEEREMNAYCIETGVAITPWSPLAGGFLAKDWRETRKQDSERARSGASYSLTAFGTDADYKVLDVLKEVATARGLPMAQVALAWLLQQPGVTAPVIGATRVPQLDDAIAALDVNLSSQELKLLSNTYVPQRHLGLIQ